MLVRCSFPPSIQPSSTMLSRTVLRALRPQGYYDTLQLNSAAAFRASTKGLSTTPNTETPPAPSTAQTSEVQEDRSGWTEVVHEATGQTYYWNQRTGQTTALGDPRPHARSGGGGGGAGGTEGDSSNAGEAVDPRAETPLPDKTGTYAAIGVILGVFFGWASQFV